MLLLILDILFRAAVDHCLTTGSGSVRLRAFILDGTWVAQDTTGVDGRGSDESGGCGSSRRIRSSFYALAITVALRDSFACYVSRLSALLPCLAASFLVMVT